MPFRNVASVSVRSAVDTHTPGCGHTHTGLWTHTHRAVDTHTPGCAHAHPGRLWEEVGGSSFRGHIVITRCIKIPRVMDHEGIGDIWNVSSSGHHKQYDTEGSLKGQEGFLYHSWTKVQYLQKGLFEEKRLSWEPRTINNKKYFAIMYFTKINWKSKSKLSIEFSLFV